MWDLTFLIFTSIYSTAYLYFSGKIPQWGKPFALFFHLSLNGKGCKEIKGKKTSKGQLTNSKVARSYKRQCLLPRDPTCIDLRMSSFCSSFRDFQASSHSLLFWLFSFLSSSICFLAAASSFFISSFSFTINSLLSYSTSQCNSLIECPQQVYKNTIKFIRMFTLEISECSNREDPTSSSSSTSLTTDMKIVHYHKIWTNEPTEVKCLVNSLEGRSFLTEIPQTIGLPINPSNLMVKSFTSTEVLRSDTMRGLFPPTRAYMSKPETTYKPNQHISIEIS